MSKRVSTEERYLPVHCYDEFTQLKEVLIASLIGTNHTVDVSFSYFYKHMEGIGVNGKLPLPEEIIVEHQKEMEDFGKILSAEGVVVREQEQLSFLSPFYTPYWKAFTRPSDNPRDQILILGDTIIETPCVLRERYFENDVWKKQLYKYFEAGSKWINPPRPMMLFNSYDWDSPNDEYQHDYQYAYAVTENSPLEGPGLEMMFDAAQLFKLGKDILFNVRNRNDEKGFIWLQREFPEYRWHKLFLGKNTDHIDGEFAILRPGLILATPNIMNHREYLPHFMQKWELIPLSDKCDSFNQFTVSSENMYINILSLNEETVFICDKAVETIQQLEKYKIRCIPVKFGWQRTFGGGLHCATLDVRRSGEMEDYSS